ncbi:MAG: hypothetical protein DRP46_04605 [Candidatus Zixiibacteriota bacterium]|nr:MAG: hypothetical protein DRP46_04605 [candidate division Zixibacteria bacterium]
MKRNWILILTLTCLVFSFATVVAKVTVKAVIEPLTDGKIVPNETVNIGLYYFNDFGEVIATSFPIEFYEQSGGTMNLQHVDVGGRQVRDFRTEEIEITEASVWIDPDWDAGGTLMDTIVGFSWDASLPDTINFSWSAFPGWLSSPDTTKKYEISVQFLNEGIFCIDSISQIETVPATVYDWLCDDPTATFLTECWEVAGPIDVKEIESNILPAEFELGQNYPNPFNPNTKMEFAVPQNSHVNISVFNILGQKIATLVDGEYAPGYYSVDWDATSDNGSEVASGIYFYRIEANNFSNTKKLMLIR